MGTVDSTELRSAMGTFATGVTVVTAGDDQPHGMTLNAFTSVSLDPAQVLICVSRSARLWTHIMDERAFTISILSHEQELAARHFATRGRPTGITGFAGFATDRGATFGHPILAGCVTWLECELENARESGDHTVFTGLVRACGAGGGHTPLLFYSGAMLPMVTDQGPASQAA